MENRCCIKFRPSVSVSFFVFLVPPVLCLEDFS